jgi:hypothetical protein
VQRAPALCVAARGQKLHGTVGKRERYGEQWAAVHHRTLSVSAGAGDGLHGEGVGCHGRNEKQQNQKPRKRRSKLTGFLKLENMEDEDEQCSLGFSRNFGKRNRSRKKREKK